MYYQHGDDADLWSATAVPPRLRPPDVSGRRHFTWAVTGPPVRFYWGVRPFFRMLPGDGRINALSG
ncbi:hypothetical protein GCM10009551_074470 [Nocardiopsis tropica]|nr:hypothetical protein TTY48_02530 [Tsukamurella sp. TY48]